MVENTYLKISHIFGKIRYHRQPCKLKLLNLWTTDTLRIYPLLGHSLCHQTTLSKSIQLSPWIEAVSKMHFGGQCASCTKWFNGIDLMVYRYTRHCKRIVVIPFHTLKSATRHWSTNPSLPTFHCQPFDGIAITLINNQPFTATSYHHRPTFNANSEPPHNPHQAAATEHPHLFTNPPNPANHQESRPSEATAVID